MRMHLDNIWTGMFGTALTALGATLSLEQVQQIVSIVVTCLGAIMTFIVMPLINWYKESKKDGKITIDEISSGAKIIADGSKEVSNVIQSSEDKKKGE